MFPHFLNRIIGLLAIVGPMAMSAAVPSSGGLVPVGTARIDITPELPIRLTGYTGRAEEAQRKESRLYARALAIGSDVDRPVVLLTVEVIGLTEAITETVAEALRKRHGIDRERVAICATHIHSGPAIRGVLPFMFAGDLPEDEARRIDAYTDTLIRKLMEVADAALAGRQPGRLGWNQGAVEFAAQRRKVVDGKFERGGWVDPDGSVDHALPLLRVTNEHGTIRALFTSYACHCTAIGGLDNFLHSDWAGEAASRLEATHEGAVALVALGCGGDANPNPRGSLASARQHGETLATAVERLLTLPFQPLGAVTNTAFTHSTLDFDHVVTRDELEERIQSSTNGPRVYAARKFLKELDAGRKLPSGVQYPIQTWMFGDNLAMLFLGGEVVSEYSLRLRREFDARRLWVNAYANDVACYIPSRKMYDEGGYEVDGSMDFYGLPTRLSAGTEDQVIEAVHRLMPAGYAPRRMN